MRGREGNKEMEQEMRGREIKRWNREGGTRGRGRNEKRRDGAGNEREGRGVKFRGSQ